MADTGWISPTNATSIVWNGETNNTRVWENTSYIWDGNSSTYAYQYVPNPALTIYHPLWLKLYGYNFSAIKNTDIINGIELRETSYCNGNNKAYWHYICLGVTSKSTSVYNSDMVTENKSTSTYLPTSATGSVYGSSSDIWDWDGVTVLTGAELKNANFAVWFKAIVPGVLAYNVYVRDIQLKIYYTAMAKGLINNTLINAGLIGGRLI